MSKTKLFVIPGKGSGEAVYSLIAETGEALASHFCSNASFAKGDLVEGRPERKKEYKEKFGEYEVVFLDDQEEITEQDLIERNKAFYKEKQKA